MVPGGRLSSGIAVLLVATVALTFPTTADEHWGEDREFTYAGTTRVDDGLNEFCDETTEDCPAPVPRGVVFTNCDDSNGYYGTGIDGIGGGKFCGIEIGATVNVTVHDELHPAGNGGVSCPHRTEIIASIPPPPFPGPASFLSVTWYLTIGEADPSLTVTIPDDCMELEYRYPPGHTELAVFFNVGDATAGTVTLEHESSG